MSKQRKKSKKRVKRNYFYQTSPSNKKGSSIKLLSKNNKKTSSKKNIKKSSKISASKPSLQLSSKAKNKKASAKTSSKLFDKSIFNSISFSAIKKSGKATALALVALIECLMILALATYSWIESSSSLTIKGQSLPVAYARASDVIQVGEYSDKTIVDLHKYYQYTSRFMLSRASSPNGTDFYFRYVNKDGTQGYRKGDTTDFNTNYYCFDFNIVNDLGISFNYYFANSDIFKFNTSGLTTNEVKIIKDAFRISITTSNKTNIYSNTAGASQAINSTTGSEVQVVTKAIKDHIYVEGKNSDDIAVFSASKDQPTKVTVRIWLEEKANTLRDDILNKLRSRNINIDLCFRMADSGKKLINFVDYSTDSFNEVNYGNNFTKFDDTNNKMYFCYVQKTGTTKVYEMSSSTSPGGATAWRTKYAFDPNTELSDTAMDKTKSYFYYGTATGASDNLSVGTKLCSWYLGGKNLIDSSDGYVFNSIGVIDAGTFKSSQSTEKLGYGYWSGSDDDSPLTTVTFDDKTTANTATPYNKGAYQFVNEAGQGSMYVTGYQGTGSNIYVPSISTNSTPVVPAVNMYLDSETGLWSAKVPSDWLINDTAVQTDDYIYFDYVNYSDTKFYRNSNVAVRFTANAHDTAQDTYKFTALGYDGTATLNSLISTQNSTAIGNGTWDEVEPVNLCTELIDTSANPNWRYKVGYGEYRYFLAPSKDAMFLTAYIPKGAGSSQNLSFYRYNNYSNTSTENVTFPANAHDDMTDTSLKNPSNTYYITANPTGSGTTGTGQWHIAVLCDGTTDNIINDIMTDSSISTDVKSLKYSTTYSETGSGYQDLNKLDNYRWYTDDFGNNADKVYFRWTTYSSEEVFEYTLDLKDGIYINVVE